MDGSLRHGLTEKPALLLQTGRCHAIGGLGIRGAYQRRRIHLVGIEYRKSRFLCGVLAFLQHSQNFEEKLQLDKSSLRWKRRPVVLPTECRSPALGRSARVYFSTRGTIVQAGQ